MNFKMGYSQCLNLSCVLYRQQARVIRLVQFRAATYLSNKNMPIPANSPKKLPKNYVSHLKPPKYEMTQASIQADFSRLPDFSEVEMPDYRKLRVMEKVPPNLTNQKVRTQFLHLEDLRGPELVNNKLIHRQFGVQALMGGTMKHGHFEMCRKGINHKLRENMMFANWRIDAPWKPKTKKGSGIRMGGGKGNISGYVTPVKAGRIIFELGGYVELFEVYHMLRIVAQKLPFPARPVWQKLLDWEENREKEIEEKNVNPFTYKALLGKNAMGCSTWASYWDYQFDGKHR